MPATAPQILERVFGYAHFRGQQQAVIDHAVAGGDSLVLMPTGGGKSLCYQIPALVRGGTAVVVSPLIALMRDQVAALLQAGVRAAYLNSTLSQREALDVEARLRAGGIDLLYAAPERLLGERTLALLEAIDLALFAIDEAHCVSQWGHDFRPEYLQLAVLQERFPGVPRMALTATADETTRREIAARLGLAGARWFVSGFDRPNIQYRVTLKTSPREQARPTPRHGASRRRRHRLLPVAPQRGRDRGMAPRARRGGAGLSRRHGRAAAGSPPGPLRPRRGRGDGRHDCFRDGHRQA